MANDLKRALNEAENKIEKFNAEEAIFGMEQTKYPLRSQIEKKLAPYKQLYDYCIDYQKKHKMWVESPVGSFNPDGIEEATNEIYRTIFRLKNQFNGIPG
uniref:Dynein heavy chain 7, axonemal n=1 Tax=Cacopsylla melanoneura TaxID=428564 RepID=A0A8D8PNV2_9HEMI